MTQPDDETQPQPTVSPPSAVPPPNPPGPAVPPPPPPSEPPPLTAKPDRPADPGWREPPWIPPRDARDRARELREKERRDRSPSPFALVVGLVLIVLGGWWFLERTLGISLPRIAWGSLWPLLLIILGGVILIRSFDRRP
jgi:hypothetical protein